MDVITTFFHLTFFHSNGDLNEVIERHQPLSQGKGIDRSNGCDRVGQELTYRSNYRP